MKKKLLITVGAGASIDFGLPSVTDVDTLLDQCAARSHPLATDPTSNLYRYCRDAIEAYYSTAPKPALRKWVNFEEVLYQFNLLMPYCSDPNRMHGSNALLAPKVLPDVLEFGRTRKPVDGTVLRHLNGTLMDGLVDHFIDACETVRHAKSAEVLQLAVFLEALQDEFEVGVITLNYDDVFTQACPGLHTGFAAATGAFDASSVLDRRNWGFLYHLHGSVHFAMTGAGNDLHGISWTATPMKDHTVHAVGRSAQDSMEGTSYPNSPFVAGYGKTLQILRQPFRTYFAQLNRLVHEADSLLFLGYGFGDLHLNALFSEVRGRRRPAVVVDWARDDQDPLPFRQDNWTYQMFRALPANAGRMSQTGQAAPAYIADLKAASELEVSNDPSYPLAVWYDGLLAACRHPQKILAHLQ